MMVMMVIDGDVSVTESVDRTGTPLLGQPTPGAEVDISPATGQNITINHHHHHHFLSTHHVAAPPRLLGLFIRRRPSTIRPLLARHQKLNLVTSTLAFPLAPAAVRTAALNSGWTGVGSKPPRVFVALSTMTLSGSSLPGPTPWYFAHAYSTALSNSRSGSSPRISSIVSTGSALPSHTSADRTVSDQPSNDTNRGNTFGRPATM